MRRAEDDARAYRTRRTPRSQWLPPSGPNQGEATVPSTGTGEPANRFRVSAYTRAANTIRRLPRLVSEILDREGIDGLQALPGIGPGIARAVRDLLVRGRLAMLERL